MPLPGDFLNDKDLPLERDMDAGSADLAEMVCPACHGLVLEDTQKCPHCGDWIIPTHPSSHGRRRWFYLAVVLLMLYAILRWTF